MHAYVCNYEHITGFILLITWDSNTNWSKIKPQSLHRVTKAKKFENGLYSIIPRFKKGIKIDPSANAAIWDGNFLLLTVIKFRGPFSPSPQKPHLYANLRLLKKTTPHTCGIWMYNMWHTSVRITYYIEVLCSGIKSHNLNIWKT